MDSFWEKVGDFLETFWFWRVFGDILVTFWRHFGIWMVFGDILESFWIHFGNLRYHNWTLVPFQQAPLEILKHIPQTDPFRILALSKYTEMKVTLQVNYAEGHKMLLEAPRHGESLSDRRSRSRSCQK